jgi:SAM-dependent methyltransferase
MADGPEGRRTSASALIDAPPAPAPPPGRPDSANAPERIVDYYSATGADYEAWSPGFNMHFGIYRRGMNPFDLESMLDRMNREVLELLALGDARGCRLLDMGCGLGATARMAARLHPGARITGVTLVPWQVDRARALASDPALYGNLDFEQCDYRATRCPDGSFDGVWALESACHASGLDKAEFIREAHRLLKPGRRLVVVDGFLKGAAPLNPLLGACMKRMTAYWALETFAEIGAFTRRLDECGFVDLQVRDESWSIAPSVLHIPRVTLKFLLSPRFRRGARLRGRRLQHVIACLLAPIVGLARSRFGYYVVCARKP